METISTPTLSLQSVLEKDKLNGTNFLDWYINLRIVLIQERKLYVLNEPILEKLVANAPRLKGMLIVSIKMTHLMLHVSCLPPWNQIHKQMVDMGAFTMVGHLREMFQDQVCIERFATIKTLLSYKMIAGSSVSPAQSALMS